MKLEALDAKKAALDRLRPLPPVVVRSLAAWFRIELTYTSNALEGNTLSRRETAVVLEKGLTIGGKSLVEHLEATNHARAIDFVHALAVRRRRTVSEEEVVRLHELVLEGIDDANAGRYRDGRRRGPLSAGHHPSVHRRQRSHRPAADEPAAHQERISPGHHPAA